MLIVKTTYINIIKTDHLKESYDRYSYVKRYKDLSELTKKSENTRNSVEEKGNIIIFFEYPYFLDSHHIFQDFLTYILLHKGYNRKLFIVHHSRH